MKARIPMTCAQKRAMDKEISMQLTERGDEWLIDVEAMVLLVLHNHFGFGKKRMLEFRKHFIEECEEMRSFYEMDDVAYPAKCKLKELGVDVEQLYKELRGKP